jgi:hypothetical protein
MDRNYLKGRGGDRINAVIAAASFNLNLLIGGSLQFRAPWFSYSWPGSRYLNLLTGRSAPCFTKTNKAISP